jgi:glutaminyl-tRNA synthetase
MNAESTPETGAPPRHFIRQIIDRDVQSAKHGGRVVTRFPPEPNGYLHIGHAKSICLNFGLAQEYGGTCHLRFDDTNPAAEDVEYVESIEADVRWLGFDWGAHHYFASNYFEALYGYAEELIEKGKAYVCTLTPEEFKEYRGVPTRPGRASPWRDRPAAESLDLFRRMRAGEFADGAYVLRAKIDMASPNLHMRDPVLYRIKRAHHHRTGDDWCLYPMYDFAHCISDAIEGITHSICTLEFEVHRPLYDWILDQISIACHPQQIEFARLNMTYTVMSKRRLLQLVQEKLVSGWDDPRMPTLCGMRRRGYPPAAVRAFCETIGVTKYDSITEVELLEHCVRADLNRHALRRIAVLDPLRVVITNFPELAARQVEAVNNPEDAGAGTRPMPFTSEIFIDRADFSENPPPKYFRLTPGGRVRLRYAGFITCERVEHDPVSGEVATVFCRWDPPEAKLKVKATIHWVSATESVPVEVRMYDRLFMVSDPLADKERDFREWINPASLQVVTARAEMALKDAQPGERFQFERVGYFCADEKDSRPGAAVFNLIVSLKEVRLDRS